MLRTIFKRVENDFVTNRSNVNVLENSLWLQSVRWARKPRWVPMAKSKIFRVPERKIHPKEENEEFRRICNHYRTEMRSLRRFFADCTKASSTGEEIKAEREKFEQEHHLACIKMNEEWNRNVSMLREQELLKEKEIEMEEIIKAIEKNKLKIEKQKELADELVRKEKENSKTYIIEENIDEAIENALASVVDYNFSIDLDGNIYKGRHTKPQPPTSNQTNEETEMMVANG